MKSTGGAYDQLSYFKLQLMFREERLAALEILVAI